MSNDFFNLNSDNDDDEEEEKEKRESAAIRRWDWDRAENAHLYYGRNSAAASNLAESFSSSTSSSSSSSSNVKKFKPDWSSSNQKQKSVIPEVVNKGPTIERVDVREDETKSTRLLFRLKGHSSTVNRVHWKKGHDTVLLSSSMDGKMFIWDLSNPSSSRSVKSFTEIHTKSIRNAIWSLNQTEIVSVSFDQTCALTDIETGRVINRLESNEILSAVCVHPTNEHVIQIGSRNCLLNWDTREKSSNKSYKAPIGLVQDIIFLNEREFVSSGDIANKESELYSIVVWDMASGARVSDQIMHDKYVCTSLARHPTKPVFYAQTHGNYIAEFSARAPFKLNRARRFETEKGEQITQGYYIGCHVNPSGSLIASGGLNGRAYVYGLESKSCELLKRVDAFVRPVAQPCMDVKFSRTITSEHPSYRQPGKCFLATASWTGLIHVFEF